MTLGKGRKWLLSGRALETHSLLSSSSDTSDFFTFLCFLCFLFYSADFDANNIFKAFFGGPGGFSFEGGCAWVPRPQADTGAPQLGSTLRVREAHQWRRQNSLLAGHLPPRVLLRMGGAGGLGGQVSAHTRPREHKSHTCLGSGRCLTRASLWGWRC